jgi:hypothetical protein
MSLCHAGETTTRAVVHEHREQSLSHLVRARARWLQGFMRVDLSAHESFVNNRRGDTFKHQTPKSDVGKSESRCRKKLQQKASQPPGVSRTRWLSDRSRCL